MRDVQLFEVPHHSTHYLYGSLGGGARIKLLGNDLCHSDGTFDTSIIVTVGGEQADVISSLSTDKQLVADTPPKPPDLEDCYSIQV